MYPMQSERPKREQHEAEKSYPKDPINKLGSGGVDNEKK